MEALENKRDDMLKSVAGAKRNRRKNSAASAAPDRKDRSPLLQGEELRRALEELRDTKSEPRAQELKRVISHSLCRA
jgi:hypothetical protein